MPDPVVHVHNLVKTFRSVVRGEGLRASLRSLARRQYTEVSAVRDISFDLQPGEVVGFIGPNGAGKTTTLKMLTGLLYPTSGEVSVLGFTPSRRQPAFLRQISMVLGNKSQMMWDIPPLDSFRVMAEIYNVPQAEFKQRLDELVDLLDLSELLTRPVRTFSLGERMKCELVAGLLHRPNILFLDEPTIGLDVSVQNRLRRFIADYNRLTGATILLTSHDMADVEILCKRVLLIHNGQLIYDGSLTGLAARVAPYKHIRLTLPENGHHADLPIPEGAELLGQEDGALTLRVDRSQAPMLTSRILSALPVADLLVEDPPIEEWIDQIYQEGVV